MDSFLTLALHDAATTQPWLATLAIDMASYGVFLLPVALLGAWWYAGRTQSVRRQAALVGLLAAIGAACLGLVLERTLGRPRPFVALGIAPLIPHALDSSFPSDHTLVGVALTGALAWRVPRVGVWLLGWALLVGAARVAAALHYPSDIVGSALLALVVDGLAWLLVAKSVQALPEAVWRRLGVSTVRSCQPPVPDVVRDG